VIGGPEPQVVRGLKTEHSSADASPGLLLWRVTHRWQAAQRAALKPFDLTHVQFVLLASLTYLDADHGAVTQRVLAEHAATDEMMTSQVLRALEVKGWVERTRHPTDGRAWLVRATAAGRALANRAVVAVEACDRSFFGAVRGQVADLTTLLQLVSRASPASVVDDTLEVGTFGAT
jgi:DNA-binding MarR family transcriptional regulator